MSKAHPNPLARSPRDPELEAIVGWFMVAFEPDRDHEYPFVVKRDGSIMPELDELDASCKDMFRRYLADPKLSSVRFIQNRPEGDREIKHRW